MNKPKAKFEDIKSEQMDTYRVHYSSIYNKFLVINERTGLMHSAWKDLRDAKNQVSDFTGQKRKFEDKILENKKSIIKADARLQALSKELKEIGLEAFKAKYNRGSK